MKRRNFLQAMLGVPAMIAGIPAAAKAAVAGVVSMDGITPETMILPRRQMVISGDVYINGVLKYVEEQIELAPGDMFQVQPTTNDFVRIDRIQIDCQQDLPLHVPWKKEHDKTVNVGTIEAMLRELDA